MIYKTVKSIRKPLKFLLYGATNSGKTLSSLKIATGMIMANKNLPKDKAIERVLLIDTEFGRGSLYADLGEYKYIKFEPPYETEKLEEILNDVEYDDNIDIVVIDSLTHFWSKTGGILDQKAYKDARGGNSYTNWQEFTAKFNKIIDRILSFNKPIFVTSRSKNDVVIDTSSGKAVPKTYGLKPELRDGIDFEFDVVFNVDKETHSLITEKSFRGLDTVYEMASEDTGIIMYNKHNEVTIYEETKDTYMEELFKIVKLYPKYTNDLKVFLKGHKPDDLTVDELKECIKHMITLIRNK